MINSWTHYNVVKFWFKKWSDFFPIEALFTILLFRLMRFWTSLTSNWTSFWVEQLLFKTRSRIGKNTRESLTHRKVSTIVLTSVFFGFECTYPFSSIFPLILSEAPVDCAFHVLETLDNTLVVTGNVNSTDSFWHQRYYERWITVRILWPVFTMWSDVEKNPAWVPAWVTWIVLQYDKLSSHRWNK